MLRILLFSLNVALLQGIPVAQDFLTAEETNYNKLKSDECLLPEYFDPFRKYLFYKNVVSKTDSHYEKKFTKSCPKCPNILNKFTNF